MRGSVICQVQSGILGYPWRLWQTRSCHECPLKTCLSCMSSMGCESWLTWLIKLQCVSVGHSMFHFWRCHVLQAMCCMRCVAWHMLQTSWNLNSKHRPWTGLHMTRYDSCRSWGQKPLLLERPWIPRALSSMLTFVTIAWYGMTLDKQWHEMGWHDMTWSGMPKDDMEWLGMAWDGMTWHDMTWHVMTWHVMTWH